WLHHLRQVFGHIIAITAADPEEAAKGQERHEQYAEHRAQQARLNASIAQVAIPAGCGSTLYEAIDAYADAARAKHQAAYGKNEAEAVQRHKQATNDMDLAELDYNAIERITLYWCGRPAAKTRAG